MDNCAIGRFTVTTPLSEEQNKKLSNYIYAVSKDDIAASMIVTDYNNGLVEQFVRNHKTFKDKYTKPLHELKHQEFKAVIREYKKYTYPSINDFAKASSSESRGLFIDVFARNFALKETSRLLADEYYNLAFKTNTTSLRGKANATKIINAAKSKAANTFIERFNIFVHLNKDEKGFDKLVDKFKELKQLNDESKNALTVLKELKEKKTLTTNEQKEALRLNKLYKENKIKINGLKEELLYDGLPIVIKHPNATNEDKNYAAMVSNMFGKETSNNWFYEVYNLPRTFAIRSAFSSIFEDRINESEKTSDAFGEIDEDFEFIDEEELATDQNTGNWSDALYNNYLKHFDGKLTVYLGNLYKTKPADITSGNDKYSYDTNNPLGVPETMGIGYVISQIINFGDYSSIENFIDSIENVAKNIPTLSGLIKLVNDMRNDDSFANEVFSNFYKYPVRKSMISYVNGDASIYHSNSKAFSGQYLFQKAFSAAKITSQIEVTPKDLNKINEFINQLGQISENKSARTKADIAEFIKTLFNQYFPGVNDDALLTWYWKDGGSKDKCYQVLNTFKEFINASRKLNKEILDKKLEVNTYNRWLRNKIKETKENSDGSPTIYDNLKSAKVDYSKFDYSELQKTTKKIIKLFEDFLPAYNEYNSANAENNNSSDLIKNSYITQFFKQIKDTEVNPDGSVTPRGLELIKNFYTRKGEGKETLQHQYSTILFGIPGVRDGLFIERNGSYFVNPDAVNMLNISLFNGIRNKDSASGEMYQKMTSLDYFNTLVNYYFNPVDYDATLSKKDDYCGILFRIPSDASNQYVFQMKKYKTDNLYNYNEEDINKFANESLYSPYISLKGFGDDLTKRYSRDLNPSIVKGELGGKDKNIKSAADIIEILRNGNLQVNNLFGYKIEYINNKMIVPLIYLEKGNSLVVYCETDSKNYKEVRNLKPISIQSLERINVPKDDSFSIGSFFGDEDIVYNTINNVFKKFVENHKSEIAKSGFQAGVVKREYNYNNELYQAFVQNVKGEINNFFNAITDLIEIEDKNGTVRYLIKKDTTGLFNTYHYKKGKIVDNGKLVGEVFNFKKLFDINGFSAKNKLFEALNIYGGLLKETEDGRLEISQDYLLYNPISKHIGDLNQIEGLNDIVSDWLDEYSLYILENIGDYKLFGKALNSEQLQEVFLNTTVAYYEMDDLFEGNASYYKDAQTFLKRDKEVQAGGSVYGGAIDFTKPIGSALEDVKTKDGVTKEVEIIGPTGRQTTVKTKNFVNGAIEDGNLTIRNGFRAVVIENVENVSIAADDIYTKIYNQLKAQGLSEDNAKSIAENVARGYGWYDKETETFEKDAIKTKYDDAQSYITIEEFIRRKYLDGTISQYGDLLWKLLDENYELSKEDYDEIISKVQVQKNFYYDLGFDKKTGLIYPRQIKNAEFVLIPKFIKGTSLERLYKIMKENDINQVNTVETSKAANINVAKFWSNNGEIIEKEIEDTKTGKNVKTTELEDNINHNPESVQTYYYNYLYKQQDFVDHIEDEVNKAGIQVIKKIIDNIAKDSPIYNTAQIIQNNLAKNIEESFNNLLDEYGWKLTEYGKIPANLDFSKFFEDARREASRLGMDSNFLEYLTPDENGRPVYPLVMNDKSSKLESIAQSIFNKRIIRQTLPGFHAVQVSDIGFDSKLKYVPRKENGQEGEVDSYVEIKVAPWSKDIIDLINEFGEEEALRQLQRIGADEIIGYRIPTEGKQSIAKMKVVGFLDPSQGSTMVVAKDWVTQTGSDFDIDTIYTITHQTYLQRYKDGGVELIMDGDRTINEEKYSEKEVNDFKRNQAKVKRNNEIVEAFKTIISSDEAFEENMSRSNFDDINKAIEKYNKQFKGASVYNPFTQIKFMQNAIDGRKLKARSVNRDTFNSISNKLHGMLVNGIQVKYNLDEYNLDNLYAAYGEENVHVVDNVATVNHKMIGWSKNNRNVVGKLVTPYSSQTTAHILDAIKSGTIFNETDYTFSAFKTLVDIGIDYNTIVSFLAQEAITDLNETYNEYNSIFSNTKNDVIPEVYRNFLKKFKIDTKGLNLTDYTSIKQILEHLNNNKDFVKSYYNYWGIEPIIDSEGNPVYTLFDDNKKLIIPSFNKQIFERGLQNNLSQDEQAVHYLGILRMFEHAKEQGDAIEELVKVSRPDATGVKQTIFNTIRFIDNVNKEMKKDGDNITITTENGESFINELYKNKQYPYLAAAFEYGIVPSVAINSQLFITSTQPFYDLFTRLEQITGKTFNEETYKKFTQYMITKVYRGLPDIVCPIALDSKGNIRHITGAENNSPDYWNQEFGRIYGFVEPQNGDNFEVSDFVNPTPEDLEAYYKLTPLQKILFLQRIFAGKDNLFTKFYVSKTSNRVDKEKGYSYNTISITSENDNIESLYDEFNRAFFSDNLFIRAAAIDLVKYAFVVEGYSFRKGNVSKIITNAALYNTRNTGGLDLNKTLNDSITEMAYLNDESLENFIRSHSELLNQINITKPADSKGTPTLGNTLNNYREIIKVTDNKDNIKSVYSGLISIPHTGDTDSVLKKLGLPTHNKVKNTDYKYIKLREWSASENKYTINVYKCVPQLTTNLQGKPMVSGYTLIPLNLLEEFEYDEISINTDNNKHYTQDFYYQNHTELVYTIDDLSAFIADKYEKQIAGISQIDAIEDALAGPASPKRNVAVKLQTQLENWLEDRTKIKDAENFGIVQVAGFAKELIGVYYDSAKEQWVSDKRALVIDEDGTTIVFKFSPYSNELNLREARKEYKKNKNYKVTPYIEKVINDDSIYWSENPEEKSLYKVEIYTELKPQEVEESEQFDNANVEETQLSAFDGVFDDWFGNATTQSVNTNASNEEKIFNVSNLIMKELQYNSYRGNTDIKKALTLMSVKGFIFGDEKSLHDYQTDIYKLAAKFYKERANELKQKIHNFVVNGKVYNIADEALYRELKNEPKKAYELYRLLLEASNFGKKIDGIEKIVIDGDTETLKYIKSIQNSINEVVKEQGLKTAFDFVYNIYLAENFSKNPNVQMGLIQLTDIFGDSDWFDTNIGDVTNINHKQVQVVTKLALNELQKAKINAIKENAEFKKKWKEIEAVLGEQGLKESLNKIIDEDGKFIQKYNKEFLDDKKKIDTEVADAIKDYGVNSVEYLKAKQKQRKWYLANVVQPYAKSYYQEVIDATDEILNKYPEYLSEYLKLKSEYYSFGPYALLTDDEKNRRKAIGIKLNSMKELFTEDGKQNDKGIALNDYEDNIKSIKKKYFKRIVSDEFIALIKHHRDIINAYKKNAGPYTLYDLYNNPDEKYDSLRESYDWLKYNTRYIIDEKSREQLQKAFKILGSVVDENRREIQEIISDIPFEERTDISGTIIGTKYSLEQARKIKELTLKRFLDADVVKDTVVDSGNPNKYNIDGNLIKVVPKGPILNKAFFDDFFSDKQHRTPEEIKLRNATYTKINNILKKAINKNGEVDVILLSENCTREELQEVINGYNVLRSLDSINQDAYTNFDANKEKPYEYATYDAAVRRQSINLDKIPNELKFFIERIIYQTEKDGVTLKTDENGVYIGNKYLYGFIKLNEDENGKYTAEAKKYIDQEKTDARDLIEDNVEYVETEYYWQALKEATENGTDDEWYEANHYYDPFKHKMVPIKIWTTMQIKSTGNLKGTMENVATYDNTTSEIKDEFKNKEYKDKIDVNKNSSYSNPTYNSLNETEQKLRDLLLEYAQKYAIADFQKQFIKQNYAPRLISRESTWGETLNDALNTVGLGSRDYTSFDWHNNIGFNNDFDAKFNMYSLIKAKGMKALPKKPSRASSIDDADYENKLALWKKECEDVEKYNKELDKALFSKDWFEVYKNLINQGEEYIAKDKVKDLLYLTLQDLREREAFDVGKRFSLSGQLIRDNKNSTNDTDGFRKIAQTNTAKTFENWVRRFLFEEYKNYTPLNQIADRIQSATSARFMMGNVLSGINNVAVGLVNISSEMFAKDYFDRDQFRRATAQYLTGAKGYVNHFFTGEVTNEQEAIMDLFNIETYDKVNNTYKDYKSYAVEKANDIAYGFLSMGEHYMQNTAVFAMLESHRLYKNNITGKIEVGTKYDFMQNIEFAAINEVLKQMAENNTGSDAAFFNSLLSNFKNIYLPTIKKDKRKALRFDRLQIDFVNDFVRSDLFNMGDKSTNTARKKKFIEEYVKVKKQLMENAEKEFNTLKTVKSQLKYNADEQREVIVPNSELTEEHIAEITQKAISVNKKIHGVYDKLGAARIESMLLGSLAMQYRKHLYPGFAKFWQNKGYYNELRQTNEYGIHQSLLGLLTIDQRHGGSINDIFNINEVNENDSKFRQFMTEFTNATKLAINSLIDIKYNWALLPDWQKRNINRIFGYLAGYGASLAAVLAIYGLVDEDDIKKSNWWGSLIFLADRLNNEAKQFSPRGLYSEFENFRNTPVVGYKIIQDFFKVMGYANEMITLGEEYNPNYTRGTYKDENKIWVTVRKNIPIYNQYQRFLHIGKNNNFYKVGENSTDQTLIKNIGKAIYNDSESKGDENAYGFIR